jgi:hypothetical protein
MGRPTKLSNEVEQDICAAIENGATLRASAEAAGIAYETMNEWMKDARPRYVKFSDSVRRANARARTELIKQVKQHGRKDWRALAWILERRFKDEYGANVDVTTAGQAVKIQIVPASQDVNADDSDQ